MHFCKLLTKQEEIRQQKWAIIAPLEYIFFPYFSFSFRHKTAIAQTAQVTEVQKVRQKRRRRLRT